MSADLAFTIGMVAGFLALMLLLLWPTRHACRWGERCPHYDKDLDIPL